MFPETGVHAEGRRWPQKRVGSAARPAPLPRCHHRESRQGGGGSGGEQKKQTAAAPSSPPTAATALPRPTAGRFPPNHNGRAPSLHRRIRELVGVSLVRFQFMLLASGLLTN